MIRTAHDIRGNLTERCQVCVVGSGAGGAVVAAELAAAGMDVLILEEGGYFRTSSFSHNPLHMLPRLYRNAGGETTLGNAPIQFTEGRCVGGGTTINAGICYRTPDAILARWAIELGEAGLSPANMARHFDIVESDLHVQPVPEQLAAEDATLIRRAAESLNYRYTRIQRNVLACQGTNQCILGCPTGAKQSTLVSYIPRALQHGARLIANCRVQQLLRDGDRITGLTADILDPVHQHAKYTLTVEADAVFVAAGAMQTPALLVRSGLQRGLPALGKALYLHPNAKCVAAFDDEIHSWQGSIQTYQIDEFADEGYTFGSTFLPPGILAMTLPKYGKEMQAFMKGYNNLSVWGVLVEDSHPGRLRFTRGGQPLGFYRVTRHDAARFRKGIALLCELYLAAGAKRVHLPLHHSKPISSQDDLAAFRKKRLRVSQLELFTVHLMGTCRMGTDVRDSVVDTDQRVHGFRNLIVSDASVFPSPIRVNPMVTIMALGRRAARRFLRQEGRRKVRGLEAARDV